MEKTKQEIFQLLLNLHKKLLEEQKIKYETIHDVTLNTNQYFQLVISHDDFEWLRRLSALMASYDEALESDNKEVAIVSKNIVALLAGDSDKKFYQQLQSFIERNPQTREMVTTVIELLKNLA